MKSRLTQLLAAMVGCGAVSPAAFAQAAPEFKFSGFGTVAAVHSSESNADFVGSTFQPNGAGHTRATSFSPDSKLGGQVNANFGSGVSAVLQLVSQQRYDNTWKPQVEWLNLKYQATPELSLRVGRIALPTSLLSESRFVGYANAWVRPPQETYGAWPFTNNDGVDAAYSSPIGSANNTVQVYYGKSTVRTPSIVAKSDPAWGVSDSVEIGSLTLKAGYASSKMSFESEALSGLVGGLAAFSGAPAPVGPQAQALVDQFRLEGLKVSAVALGAIYDPGDWFVMGEVVSTTGVSFFSDSNAWYASAGYRFGAFTPYASYGKVKAKKPVATPIDSPSAAPLNAGLNAVIDGFGMTQHTVSAGMRWDFMKNVALKAQVDRITTGDKSTGRYANVQPGYVPGGTATLVTVAVDFVF